jgi:NADPH2:quinone reductase
MLAVRCHEWMPYQQLPLENIPPPVLGAGQVRIGVHYAGVSFATSLVTMGRYQRRPPRPFSPGTEITGVVLETAPGVTQVATGDRVCAVIDWGGHAEEVVTDPATVYKLPDSLPFHLAVSQLVRHVFRLAQVAGSATAERDPAGARFRRRGRVGRGRTRQSNGRPGHRNRFDP